MDPPKFVPGGTDYGGTDYGGTDYRGVQIKRDRPPSSTHGWHGHFPYVLGKARVGKALHSAASLQLHKKSFILKLCHLCLSVVVIEIRKLAAQRARSLARSYRMVCLSSDSSWQ